MLFEHTTIQKYVTIQNDKVFDKQVTLSWHFQACGKDLTHQNYAYHCPKQFIWI